MPCPLGWCRVRWVECAGAVEEDHRVVIRGDRSGHVGDEALPSSSLVPADAGSDFEQLRTSPYSGSRYR